MNNSQKPRFLIARTRNRRRIRCSHLFLAAIIAGLSAHAGAAPLNIPEAPLLVTNTAEPNLMFMVDNSGSMNNIVPEAPYDPDADYLSSCPSANLIPPGASVDLRVRNESSGTYVVGAPYIRHSGDQYRFGTGSGQKCFDNDAVYSARLLANGGGSSSNWFSPGGGYLDADYTGHYLNWYFDPNSVADVTWDSKERSKPISPTQLASSRMQIARNTGSDLISGLDERLRAGLSTYNGSNGGYLRVPINKMLAPQRSAMTTGSNGIENLTPSGSTPIAETLSDIGRYFANGYTGALTLHPDDGPSSANVADVFDSTFANNTSAAPITLSCQQSFAILLTDGRPQSDQDVSSHLEDYDRDCVAADPACSSHDQKPAPYDYESSGSDYLDDVAQALYEIDLRPDFPVEINGEQFKNNVVSYIIGFADQQVLNDPLVKDAGDQGGGGFFTAEDSTQLTLVFNEILTSILGTAASFSSTSLNSTSLSAGSQIFQSSFDSANWAGDVIASKISNGTNCGATQKGRLCPSSEWSAADELDGKTPDSRTIITMNGSGTGVSFRWGSLDAAQQSALNIDYNHLTDTGTVDDRGQLRLEFLRGDRSLEADGSFRNRSSVLGNIVGSDPYFVGAPNQNYPFGGYAGFRASNSSRTPVVYIGSNSSAMLHGFNAETGEELLAYVPNQLFGTDSNPGLAKQTAIPYSHTWGVNGSPNVGDVQIGGNWASYLVAGLKQGGQGLFALDVTDPSGFSEGSASTIAKWEFTDADDADLGYVYGQPAIVKMANGKWAAILGNGINSAQSDGHAGNGQATLFIIFIEGPSAGSWTLGSDYIKIKVGPSGQDNGIASVAPVDIDGDSVVDFIFGGDLQGNMWQFNVTADGAGSWVAAYGGTPLFTATDGTDPQPITAVPEVGLNLLTDDPDDIMVYFGTGKYLEVSDTFSTSSQTQTFYAIFADPVEVADPFTLRSSWTAPARSDLLEQEVVAESKIDGRPYRVTSDHELELDKHKGWYIDLPISKERQITRPVLRNGNIVFTTMIPSSDPCAPGGRSWLMEVSSQGGARPATPVLDVDDDLVIDGDDVITITVDGEDVDVPISGVATQVTEGLMSSPAVLAITPDLDVKFTGLSSTGVLEQGELGNRHAGRITWREIDP